MHVLSYIKDKWSSANIDKNDVFFYKKLLAILLVGNIEDYRDPAVYLFKLPFKDPQSEKLYNKSTITIFGMQPECNLHRGIQHYEVVIKVRTTPVKRASSSRTDLEFGSTFCFAAYDHLEDHLWSSPAAAAHVLTTGNERLAIGQCRESLIFTSSSTSYMKELVNKLEELDYPDTSPEAKLYTELTRDHAEYFDHENRIPNGQKQFWPTKCTSDKECTSDFLAKVVEKMTAAIKEKNPQLAPFQLRSKVIYETLKTRLTLCMDAAYRVREGLKIFKSNARSAFRYAIELLSNTEKDIENARQTFLNSKILFERRFINESAFSLASEELEKAENSYSESQEEVSFAFTAGSTYAEKIVFISKIGKSVYENLVRQYKIGMSGGNVFCPESLSNDIKFLPTTIVIKRPGTKSHPSLEYSDINFKIHSKEMQTELMLQPQNFKYPTLFEDSDDTAKNCGLIPGIQGVAANSQFLFG